MKQHLLYLFAILFIGFATSAQIAMSSQQQVFNESQYKQVSQGFDPEFGSKLYAVSYKNSQDSNYTMKMLYRSSDATQMVAKRFYKAGVPEGPFSYYENGAVSLKENYINGKLDGDRLTYQNGVLVQEAHFQNGRKTGAWREYSKQGQLQRTVTYDAQENMQVVQATSQTTTPATKQEVVNQ